MGQFPRTKPCPAPVAARETSSCSFGLWKDLAAELAQHSFCRTAQVPQLGADVWGVTKC